jgi:hypothetical protein
MSSRNSAPRGDRVLRRIKNAPGFEKFLAAYRECALWAENLDGQLGGTP